MSRKVTILDIARQSNTSKATVSLVLRDKPGIAGETRQRVLAAARALGYQRRAPLPDADGPALRNVGLIVRARQRWRDIAPPSGQPFYPWVLAGIEAAARPLRLNLLYATLPVGDDNRPLDLPHHLLEQPLDGMLLVGAFDDETTAAVAGERAAPVVLVDAPAGPHAHDAVASDNQGGAHAAVSHLIARGHRHIVFVGRGRVDPNFAQRRAGYLQALRDHGVADHYLVDEHPTPRRAADAAVALLRQQPRITAVFGCNDNFASAALQAAQHAGRRVPEDLSVIGFDDIELASDTFPPLTTLAVDKVRMGSLAVQALAHRLAWPAAATLLAVLRPHLVERESVAQARRS